MSHEATSMLLKTEKMTDIGDEVCRWQFANVGDDHFSTRRVFLLSSIQTMSPISSRQPSQCDEYQCRLNYVAFSEKCYPTESICFQAFKNVRQITNSPHKSTCIARIELESCNYHHLFLSSDMIPRTLLEPMQWNLSAQHTLKKCRDAFNFRFERMSPKIEIYFQLF